MTTLETIIIASLFLLLLIQLIFYQGLKQRYDKTTLELYDRITDLENQIKDNK